MARFPMCLQGSALGKCPKAKLFRGYIELEIQLREFDRCRKLYEKFLEYAPENCTTWMRVSHLSTVKRALHYFFYLYVVTLLTSTHCSRWFA